MIESSESEAELVESSAELNPEAVANIRADTPNQYTVKSGDTLWGIAGYFLNDPWYWPELWAKNPQINNPHLIFPGDIISLIYINGQPVFQVSRNGRVVTSSAGTTATTATPQGMASDNQVETNTFQQVFKDGPLRQVRLSPRIRSTDLKKSIKIIPNDAIEQFTTRPQVITLEQWQDAPYIIGSDDRHLILGQGNRIYIRGELDKEKLRYNIYRKGQRLNDPKTGDTLGYEVIFAGEASITKYDNPTSGRIIKAKREIIIGDRLLISDNSDLNNLFFPKPPETLVDGQIISLTDALSGIGQYQIAVINLGKRDGLEVGHILATYTKGETVRDRFEEKEGHINIKLPNERSGMLMLFKIFDRVSYGLVLEATRIIKRYDQVRTPYK
ncbi:MAG: LysM peptidoglycan-binding domain-containing protein [Gammaproteobacteria bacterium]|nr:LysM peptidoglycan-binding domain-containing protein [Gammaproteobacteria bacterium]